MVQCFAQVAVGLRDGLKEAGVEVVQAVVDFVIDEGFTGADFVRRPKQVDEIRRFFKNAFARGAVFGSVVKAVAEAVKVLQDAHGGAPPCFGGVRGEDGNEAQLGDEFGDLFRGEVVVAALLQSVVEGTFPQAAGFAGCGAFLAQEVFFGEVGKGKVEAEATDDVFQAVVIERGNGAFQGSAAFRVGVLPFFDVALAQVFDGLQGVAACLTFNGFAKQVGKQADSGAELVGVGGGRHHDDVFSCCWIDVGSR